MARDKFNATQFGSRLSAWLPFLFYCMLAIVVLLVDTRFNVGRTVRNQTQAFISPMWWLVNKPQALWQDATNALQLNSSLHKQIARMEKQQLQSSLALQNMLAMNAENISLHRLLNAKQSKAPSARLVSILHISSDPTQKLLVINQGSKQNVVIGQVLIDAHGLVGQVAEVYANQSVVIAITDADHAVPVMVARSGFRSILYGQGKDVEMLLANLTPSDDVKVGDVLLTSGVGGVFPPGIPVARVQSFVQDPALTFLNARAAAFARMQYGRYLLLLDAMPVAPEVLSKEQSP